MIDIREKLTTADRATPLSYTIDPGFVHHRKIQSVLGPQLMEIIDAEISKLPEMPDGLRQVRIDHIYTHVFLLWCNKVGIKSLEEILATSTNEGLLFCSTETLGPCPQVFQEKTSRVISQWIRRGVYPRRVEFHYSTKHIRADTIRASLSEGGTLSIIAELTNNNDEAVVFQPLIMGFPKLEVGDTKPAFQHMWFGNAFFENFIEDFDEFAQVREFPKPNDCNPMSVVAEKAFKNCLGNILGGSIPKDWGGETSDFYSAHLHLGGKRVTGAFLLKGPAKFAPMTLNMLGKGNDQIVRLAQEPADVLFVQHCHDITSPVRSTLRAFSVQPSRPRRYCLIDGRDSLWLLQAYGLYEKAIELSETSRRRSAM